MKIVGCDLHARQQTIAIVDTETDEFTEKTLSHEGNAVRAFYAGLAGPVVVGIEATGAMQWFLELLEELGIGWDIQRRSGPRKRESRSMNRDYSITRAKGRILRRARNEERKFVPSVLGVRSAR
jgi:hypothetical protein